MCSPRLQSPQRVHIGGGGGLSQLYHTNVFGGFQILLSLGVYIFYWYVVCASKFPFGDLLEKLIWMMERFVLHLDFKNGRQRRVDIID